MEIRRTAAFVRAHTKLTADEQREVDDALRQLVLDPHYPSLQSRKWSGDLWYARASRDLRFFYEVGEGYYLLRDVGHHDIERSH